MRTVQVLAFGGLEMLTVTDVPDPVPSSGEVRVRIEAAGLSFADLLVRNGLHPERRRPPFTPGWDFVGRIDAVGPGVTDFKTGDRVAGLPVYGGHSEAIIIDAQELVRVPEALDAAEAVSLVMDYVVAWQMMNRMTRVSRHDLVLVHGAAGGVGTAALQLAAIAGARAYGTARHADLDTVRAGGAVPIDADAEDFVAVVRDAGGADVVLDGIGGWHLVRSLRATKRSGLVVFFGMTTALRQGRTRGLGSVAAWAGSAMITGAGALLPGPRLVLYSIQRLKRRHPDWFREDLQHLLTLLEAGRIRPHVSARLPLDEIGDGHRRLGAGERGKFVLIPGSAH